MATYAAQDLDPRDRPMSDDAIAPRLASSARRRTQAPREAPTPFAALMLLVSAQFVVMLDTSIVNVALPSIRGDLGIDTTGATWIVNTYVLSFGGLLLVSGRLADILGRRRMFVVGSAVLLVGTLLAASAASEAPLIAGRLVQGIGAAALSPSAMSILLRTFPGMHRARALSLWGAASALGGASGVLVGGLLAGTAGWRAVFLVTVPVSVLAITAARRVLPADTGTERRPIDVAGSATITAAVVSLVFAALNASDHGWTSLGTVGSLGLAAALGAAFGVIERRAVDPAIPLHLFRSQALRVGTLLAVLGGAARASTFVLVALVLQDSHGLMPQQAGLAMLPTSVTGVAVSILLLPRLLRALGPRRTLSLGLGVLSGGHLWLAHPPLGAGYWPGVLPGLLLVAFGVAASFTPTTAIIAGAVDERHVALASGLAGSSMQVGAALGIATFIALGLGQESNGADALTSAGFSAAFTAAAVVAVVGAVTAMVFRGEERGLRARG